MNHLSLWELPVATLLAGPLSVRYIKSADRLAHCIGLRSLTNGLESFLPILESIEGDASEAWPVSPPMQQIVQESIGQNSAPVLLGVGLSGNGHWSSAVEAATSSSLKLDVACKNSKPASYLGSRYRALGGMEIDFGTTEIKVFASQESAENVVVVLSVQIGRVVIDERNRYLSIAPGSDPESLQTHRWCYEVAVRPSQVQ